MKSLRNCLLLCPALALVACAAPQPVPFDLVDRNNTAHRGVFDSYDQSMRVRIGDKEYRGFYITETGVANTSGFSIGIGSWGRYGGAYGAFPYDRHTTYSNNTARAHLKSADGEQLNCQFVFEYRRAVGECRSPQGETYQLVADQPKS